MRLGFRSFGRWFFVVVFALVAGCAGGSHSFMNAVPNAPNAPDARVVPDSALTLGQPLKILGRSHPHYFYSRTFLRAHPEYANWHPESARAGVRPHSGTGPPYYGLMTYGGGPVQTVPVVYLIFWGISGPTDTTHDPDGVATYLTNFFSSIPGSSWLDTDTQYSQQSGGITSFITNPPTQFGGAVYDATPPSSTNYTDADTQAEATKYAAIHGNLSNANYIVVTGTGYTTCDGPGSCFGTQFCGYHSAVSVTGGVMSYTILPYTPDVPLGGCGAGAQNSPGTDDGESIVGGHEEAETQTDPQPNSGWLDSSGNEIGDKCAWYQLANTSFGGTTIGVNDFPTQPLYSNATNTCVQSYTGTGPTPTPSPTPPPVTNIVGNPGFENGSLSPWTSCRSSKKMPKAAVTTVKPHSGTFDGYAGTFSGHVEPAGITSVCQLVTIPANGQLTVWTRGISNDFRSGVVQFGLLLNTSGTTAAKLFVVDRNDKHWVKRTFNLAKFANGQYYLSFGIQGKANAGGRAIGQFVDDVTIP